MLLKFGLSKNRKEIPVNIWSVLEKDGKIIWADFLKIKSIAYSQGGRKHPTYNQKEAWHHPITRTDQNRRGAYPPFCRAGTWCSMPMWKLNKKQSLHCLACFDVFLHFSVLLPVSEQGQDQLLSYPYYKPAKVIQVFGWKICVGKKKYTFKSS
jgi:hypothetical protein